MPMLVKGSHIVAEWFETYPVILSGASMKLGAKSRSVSGTVRHIRVSTPEATEAEAIFIDPDGEWDGPTMRPPRCTCPKEHVFINPKHIVSVE